MNKVDNNNYWLSSSVIPISFIGKDVYFLLGKESFNEPWRESHFDVWSGFGGKGTSDEECFEKTGAREFYEETLGLVLPENDIFEKLKNKEYCFHFELSNLKKMNKECFTNNLLFSLDNGVVPKDLLHHYFFVIIPFDGTLPKTFNETRSKLISVTKLIEEIKEYYSILLPLNTEIPIVVPKKLKESIKSLNSKYYSEILTKLYVKLKLLKKINFTHPAIQTKKNQVIINYDFLEKDEINWFSLQEIVTRIKNHFLLLRQTKCKYTLPSRFFVVCCWIITLFTGINVLETF